MLNRIDAFVAHASKIIADNWKHPTLKAPILTVEQGQKWAKVWRMQAHAPDKRESIYAFIATEESITRTLGQVKIGDIHKPASTTTPAKHKRGSVFQEDFGNCAGPYGLTYLRN